MSTESDAVSQALSSAATGPASVESDAGSVRQQPLPDLIAADKYFRSRDAARSPRRGVKFTKLIPPGTV